MNTYLWQLAATIDDAFTLFSGAVQAATLDEAKTILHNMALERGWFGNYDGAYELGAVEYSSPLQVFDAPLTEYDIADLPESDEEDAT